MPPFKKPPRCYQPRGFEIIHEDRDIIVGIKAAGFLTVAAAWNRDRTIHSALNEYVRKGNSKSHKRVFVVHRLDQDTSGVMIYAKSYEAQTKLKDNWKSAVKIYYAVVHGRLKQKSGTFTSYLSEDDDYVMHSHRKKAEGKLAQTEYKVVKETPKFSLVKINLLTGRKNQIRVHLADEGHPVVGDAKYREGPTKYQRLALHSWSISFPHPFSRERLTFEAPVPDHFRTLVGEWDEK